MGRTRRKAAPTGGGAFIKWVSIVKSMHVDTYGIHIYGYSWISIYPRTKSRSSRGYFFHIYGWSWTSNGLLRKPVDIDRYLCSHGCPWLSMLFFRSLQRFMDHSVPDDMPKTFVEQVMTKFGGKSGVVLPLADFRLRRRLWVTWLLRWSCRGGTLDELGCQFGIIS